MDSITGFFDQSTVNIILKLVLIVLLGVGAFFYFRWLRKQAVKRSEEEKNRQMGKVPEENRRISDDVSCSEGEIDDILDE